MAGYAMWQQQRGLIEQGSGWARTMEPIRQVMTHGLKNVDPLCALTMVAGKLTRMRIPEQIRAHIT